MAVGAMYPAVDSSGPSNGTGPFLAVSYVDVPYGEECHTCRRCVEDEDRHEAFSEGPEERYVNIDGSHLTEHGCTGAYSVGGFCNPPHVYDWNACPLHLGGEGDPIAFQDVLNTVFRSDMHELKQMLAQYPAQIRLNSSRTAVQAYGCGDAIVAHLPLTDAAVAALGSASY
jgi:hypothetical protein